MEKQEPLPEASKPDAEEPKHPSLAPTAQVAPEGQDSNTRREDAPPVPDTYAIEIGPICKALDELSEKAKRLVIERHNTQIALKATERSLELHLNIHTTMDELLGLASRSREEIAAALRADIAELKAKAAALRREIRPIRAQKRSALKIAEQINEAHQGAAEQIFILNSE